MTNRKYNRNQSADVLARFAKLADETEKPGAVCSECGRTVTVGGYSTGESTCCKAEVCAEEEYGRAQ